MKKIIMLIILGIMLNSCGELRYGIQKTMYEMEQDREEREATKKDGPGAISKGKYRGGGEEAIKDILARPINKKVQFGEATLLIPQNTIINFKQRNIVDMKTGYGIPIIFSETERCSNIFYYKQIKKEQYYKILYDEKDFEISKISEKIIKANGFTKTCN